ncbi:chitin deacetylase 7-like [Montipora foliosa]|uniref:chitin deacetylase 7-like n=1 Tax=Montipora foliosa TaxID=591990 RepID=UPI0035F2133A
MQLPLTLFVLCSSLVVNTEGAILRHQYLGPAQPCSPAICKLPSCWCSGTDIPGNLPKDKVPQIIMLSFDAAINNQVDGYYNELFSDGMLKNPNNCSATATFFVSHEYTQYEMAQALYHKRHDIADNSISHRSPSTWWKNANYSELTDEIAGQKEILRKWGQVNENDVVGFRAPFLQIGGNTMYQVLYDNKFLYDSSMPTWDFIDPPMWPYTLEYRSKQECVIPPCPTNSFPGLWEVPMIDYIDSKGYPCNMIDECTAPADEQDVYNLLNTNFERHYKSNRAPFPMFMHASWFKDYSFTLKAVKKFLLEKLSYGDVWMVGVRHAIEWIKTPTSLDDIENFSPWKCDTPSPPPACKVPNVCGFPDDPHYLWTCTKPCPPHYPWVGNPDGN